MGKLGEFFNRFLEDDDNYEDEERQIKRFPDIYKNNDIKKAKSERDYDIETREVSTAQNRERHVEVFGKEISDEQLAKPNPVPLSYDPLLNETFRNNDKNKQVMINQDSVPKVEDIESKSLQKLPINIGKKEEENCEKKVPNKDEGKEKVTKFDWPSRTIFTPLKKNIIILAVENTSKVREYKETVLRIISKIIEDNKDSMFCIFRMGYRPKYYGMMGYDILQKNNVKENLLEDTEEQDRQGLLYEVLKYIKHIINTIKLEFNKIDVDGKKYEITSYNIVFLGTANFESSTNELSSEILKELKSNKIIKSTKYFCIDDKNTVNAAEIGFPIIGHIESNFYK